MKKVATLIFLLIVISLSLILSSCEQDSVDSVTGGIIDAGANALGPFFQKTEDSGSDENPTTQSSNPIPEGSVDSNPLIPNPTPDTTDSSVPTVGSTVDSVDTSTSSTTDNSNITYGSLDTNVSSSVGSIDTDLSSY